MWLIKIVAWYLSYGFSISFAKEDLINNLKTDEEIYYISKLITDEEILNGKKPPAYRYGDAVEVIVNAKNLTYHKGVIHEMKWHGTEKEWLYNIYENDKNVGKRYYEKDLRLIRKHDGN